jgi:DNA-binding transcriptional LysR family regulator
MKLPPGFDLHSLEVFMLTAELGGMTQSGLHLGMTQSAVSQTISKLEAALNTKLFDRTVRPLSLTASGKLLLRDGSRLLSSAKGLLGQIRYDGELPAESVTIAMAESMANLLTTPLLHKFGHRAERWRFRSGISLAHHGDFLSRKIDMLISGSADLEDIEVLDHFPIVDEEYVLILPASYDGPVDPVDALSEVPFVRYSLQSSMGQRTERQIARMRLQLANFVEVDSTKQQISAVREGLGWSLTTPFCLASHPDMLVDLRVEPMLQAQFRRQLRLVARRGEFGDLPRLIAAEARRFLQEESIQPLIKALPWIEQKMIWSKA